MDTYMVQRTLADDVVCRGVGLHSGCPVTMVLKPADPGTGLYFVRTDCPPEHSVIPARWSSVVKTELCTVLGNEHGVCVATVEHVMAALASRGITNAVIEIDGPEVPACDGSAAPFIDLMDYAGIETQQGFVSAIQVLEPVTVHQGASWLSLEPSDCFSMDFVFDFGLRAVNLPTQTVHLEGDYSEIMEHVSQARTVGFFEEYEMLKERGFARGGSLENAVVYQGTSVMNPEGLRYPDECVRHKILDAIGDLYLLGAPLLGALKAHGSGHTLNTQLMCQLMSRPETWRWAFRPEEAFIRVHTLPRVKSNAFHQSSVFCFDAR